MESIDDDCTICTEPGGSLQGCACKTIYMHPKCIILFSEVNKYIPDSSCTVCRQPFSQEFNTEVQKIKNKMPIYRRIFKILSTTINAIFNFIDMIDSRFNDALTRYFTETADAKIMDIIYRRKSTLNTIKNAYDKKYVKFVEKIYCNIPNKMHSAQEKIVALVHSFKVFKTKSQYLKRHKSSYELSHEYQRDIYLFAKYLKIMNRDRWWRIYYEVNVSWFEIELETILAKILKKSMDEINAKINYHSAHCRKSRQRVNSWIPEC